MAGSLRLVKKFQSPYCFDLATLPDGATTSKGHSQDRQLASKRVTPFSCRAHTRLRRRRPWEAPSASTYSRDISRDGEIEPWLHSSTLRRRFPAVSRALRLFLLSQAVLAPF